MRLTLLLLVVVTLLSLTVLLSELVDQLKRQTSTSALVAIDSRGHQHKVGSHELLNNRDGYCSCFIDNQQLRLTEFGVVLRPNVLDGLSVISVDVDSHDCVVELGIGTLKNLVILVLLIA